MQTVDSETAVKAFSAARDAYLESIGKVPPDGFTYLRPGDDYSLGGLAVHVNFVLDHYTNVLTTLVESGFTECRPEDPPGLEERARARARSALQAQEVQAELARTDKLHKGVVETIGRLSPDLNRSAPVWYPGGTEAYPSSAADVLKWLTDHYEEHVPQIEELVAEWQGGGSNDPVAVVTRFNEAFGRGDVDAVMGMMTEDCIFEDTEPPPDGERYVGQAAVRQSWERFFADTEAPRFETEELFAAGDRVVGRWRFSWGSPGSEGNVRGVDLFRVRDGKVAEKLAYVKG